MVMESLLELNAVSKVYGSGRTAVTAAQDINLSVVPGEIVLIMGPSGSGKTTMLSIAGLLLSPTTGTITIGGNKIDGLSQAQIAALRLKNLGFVFQSYNLLSALSAQENVEIVMSLAGTSKKISQSRAIDLLTRLGLEKRLDHLPGDLSGGEKQRVAIARALANDASLILADEPTGNLDKKTGREVMELLCCGLGRKDERSIVIVTHDQRLRDIADRVLWLEDGRLSRHGTDKRLTN